LRKNLNFGEKDNIFSTFSQNESKDFSRKLRIFWEKLNFLHIFQENKEFWRKTKFLHIFPSAASNQNFSTGWHCEHAVIIMRKPCLFLKKIGFFSKWHFSQKNRIFLEMTVKTSQENKQKNGPILDKTFRNMQIQCDFFMFVWVD